MSTSRAASDGSNCHTYLEALQLEVSLLEALLKRNRCAHQKTKYYQRVSMTLRATQRANLLGLPDVVTQWKVRIEERIRSSKKRKRNKQDVTWDVSTLQNEKKLNSTILLDDNSLRTLEKIHQTLQTQFPEILSRIQFASEALFLEISRAFFVPICTVALGALGRIRVIVMRLGHAVLDLLDQVQRDLVAASFQYTTIFISADEVRVLRNKFTEDASDQSQNKGSKEKLLQLRRSLGMTDPKTIMTKENGLGIEEQHSDILNDMEYASSPKEEKLKPEIQVDENDVGEALVSTDVTFAESPDKVLTKPIQKAGPTNSTTTSSKQQMHPVQDMVDKKNKAIKDTKKRKSSSKDTKKKEKKKKRPKKDFFDDLFD